MSAVHTPNNFEDWDRSLLPDDASTMNSSPQNGVAFPGDGQSEGESMQFSAAGKGKRTLSELLKLHAEEGTDATFSPEEANRVAEVLGQWINSSSSPYEAEDDFFTHTRAQDDSSLPLSKRSDPGYVSDSAGRPRGQSESVVRLSS